MLDRIAAALLCSAASFVGLFLLDMHGVIWILYGAWGIVGIPFAVLVILCFLPKRLNRLGQVWSIAGILTLLGIALIGLPPWLWLILNQHNAGTITGGAVQFLVASNRPVSAVAKEPSRAEQRSPLTRIDPTIRNRLLRRFASPNSTRSIRPKRATSRVWRCSVTGALPAQPAPGLAQRPKEKRTWSCVVNGF